MAFFVLAFDISWTLWLLATLDDSPALLLLMFLEPLAPAPVLHQRDHPILPRLHSFHAVGRRPLCTLHPYYNNTAGSLLAPVLLHATVNFFAATLTVLPASEADDARPFLLYTLLVCLLAAAVVLLAGPRLPRRHRIL